MKLQLSNNTNLSIKAILACCLVVLLFPWFTDLKFIFVSIAFQIIIGNLLISRYSFCISKNDIIWFAFVVLCFVSAFYAVNPSLAIFSSFVYLQLYIVLVSTRSIASFSENFQKSLLNVLCFSFWAIFVLVVLSMLSPFRQYNGWQLLLGSNRNYALSLLVFLSPFVIFTIKNKSIWLFVVLGIFLTTFYVGSKGALFCFSLVIFVSLLKNMVNFWSDIFRVLFIIICIVVVLIVFIENNITDYLYSIDSGRTFMIQTSGNSNLFSLLRGVGLGNWIIDAYDTELTLFPGGPFNSPNTFIRPRNHNFISLLMSELGILGLLIYGYIFQSYFRIGQKKELIYFIMSLAVFLYLLLANFYCSVNSFEHHFSSIMFLVFILQGCSNVQYLKLSRKFLLVLFVCNLIVGGYFGILVLNRQIIIKSESLAMKQDFTKSAELLASIYSPLFYSNYDYRNSIAGKIAKLYVKAGNDDQAIHYFKEALSKNPHNEILLLSYANFLFTVGSFSEAKEIAQKLYFNQRNNFDVNKLLFEIACVELDYTLAYKHLDRISAFVKMKSYAMYIPIEIKLRNRFNEIF